MESLHQIHKRAISGYVEYKSKFLESFLSDRISRDLNSYDFKDIHGVHDPIGMSEKIYYKDEFVGEFTTVVENYIITINFKPA